MTAFERIIPLLKGVRMTGEGRAIALCPAHPDRNPSMSFTDLGGKAGAHCHAGCTVDAICAALRIGKGDLFDEPRGPGYRPDPEAERRRRIEKGLKLWTSERLTHSTGMARECDRLVDQLSPATWALLSKDHPDADRLWNLLAELIRLREQYDAEIEVLIHGNDDDRIALYERIHHRKGAHESRDRVRA